MSVINAMLSDSWYPGGLYMSGVDRPTVTDKVHGVLGELSQPLASYGNTRSYAGTPPQILSLSPPVSSARPPADTVAK